MPPGIMPPTFNPALAGSAGGALIQAMMHHRERQKAAAHFRHPPTIPMSYPGAPDAGLASAVQQQLPARAAGRQLAGY